MLSTETPPALTGDIVTPDHAEWDIARRAWNLAVDQRPALVAFPADAADVQSLIEYAIRSGLKVAPQGTGHNAAALGALDDTILLSTQRMRGVEIDPEARTARVQAGTLWLEVTEAATPHGLFPLSGSSPDVGVVGYTLGGGLSWLARRHGLAANAVTAIELVTPDAQLVRATADVHPDLFWALRGGGGNFGVVTSFEFRLHPVGPEVWSGLVVYAGAQARQVLRAWRDFNAAAPEALSVWAVLRKAPPLPFIPTEHHGRDVVIFPLLYAGDMAAGEKAAAPVATFGTPIGTHLGPTPYAGFQQAFDPLLAPGGRNYWKTNNFSSLSDAALDLMIEAARSGPGPECEIFVAQLGGAMARVDPAATAFVGRDAAYIMNVHGRWVDAGNDKRVRDWARKVFTDSAPHATGGGYVNFLTEDEGERVAATYGGNYARLQAVKQRHDPGNLFRANLNIAPQAGG